MTHDEALELIEIAAAEPDGFERLAAGDRPEAAALAGHLAGCSSCRAEYDEFRRLSVVFRSTLVELPPEDLRDRTLAVVAALGRPRPGREDARLSEASVPAAAPGRSESSPIVSRRRQLLRLAGLAAALLVALGVGALAGVQSREGEVRQQALTVRGLERVAAAALAVAAEPDARSVALASTDGRAAGRVLFSPTTGQLVVVATGLEPPPPGAELRCWVEVAGERMVVGRMVFAADLAYWAGPAEVLTSAELPSRFGISLVRVSGGEPGEPILEGRP